MKCTKCGQEVDSGAIYCGNCGQQVVPSPQQISSQPAQQAGSIDPIKMNPVEPSTFQNQLETSQVQENTSQSISSLQNSSPNPKPIENTQYSGVATTGMIDPAVQKGGGKAIASLVFGVLGLIAWLIPIVGLLMGILAIIFGSLTVKSFRKGFAIAGIILGSIVVLLSLFAWVYNVQELQKEREETPISFIENFTILN